MLPHFPTLAPLDPPVKTYPIHLRSLCAQTGSSVLSRTTQDVARSLHLLKANSGRRLFSAARKARKSLQQPVGWHILVMAQASDQRRSIAGSSTTISRHTRILGDARVSTSSVRSTQPFRDKIFSFTNRSVSDSFG